VREMLLASGFDWLAYGTVSLSGPERVPTSFLTTYAHRGWTQRYFTERHHDVDPRHDDSSLSGVPLVWDLTDLERSGSRSPQAPHSPHTPHTPHQHRFIADLRASGIGSGVFLQLVSAGAPGERTLISLQSGVADRRWISDAVLGRALALGLCLHDFISRHARLQGPLPVQPARSRLSSLQQQILQCLQRGQSDKQIAHGLQLSASAVDYHMRQLRRRFSARNRVQLANAAL
jgi:DNA-binding CsgD family transcriptional regulator